MDWKRQLELISGGSQTRSKVGRFTDISPVTIQKGYGAYIWGDDGKRYLDYTMALGAILLGYGTHEEVIQAVTKQLRRGAVYGLPSLLEGELAEQLLEYYPHYDMVRFGKNGVDSTMAAIRLARAVTGRNHFISSGYHGCADIFEITGDNKRGIPGWNGNTIHKFEFNDITALSKLLDSGTFAALIIEQPPEAPSQTFYKDLRMLCNLHGVIWIQDEIVTGFRYAMGGAQEKYGFEPDLTCLGKCMANGLPISALLGKKELMREFTKGVSWSSTFGGELTSISAALACIKLYSEGSLSYYTKNLTDTLKRGLRALKLDCIGDGGRLVINFKKEKDRMSYLEYMHSHNIFIMDVPIFLSMSHTAENIQKTIEISGEAVEQF